MKVTISVDLELTYKYYKNKLTDSNLLSWADILELNNERLLILEDETIENYKKNLLVYDDYQTIVSTSMGKDSIVIEHLTSRVKNDYKVVFANTSLDCADTYLMVKNNPHIEIINPEEGFYQWVKRLHFIPTRISRACCGIFKEGNLFKHYKNVDKILWIIGIRNQESAGRSDRQDIEVNPNWDNTTWVSILPIRKWTELDIWLYMLKYDLQINTKYKKGYWRVGCAIACPYYKKSTWVLDEYWYPTMYKRWWNIVDKDFIENNKQLATNCTLKEYRTEFLDSLIVNPQINEDAVFEYAENNNISIDIARKYFERYCVNGCLSKTKKPLRIREKDILAMNMKMFGRNIEKFMCRKCLMKELGLTKSELSAKVKEFKESGCSLF